MSGNNPQQWYNLTNFMENIVEYLKHLDLSDVEIKLYLTLLKSGPTSVRDLALTVAIKRTTAYFYIDQLVEKNLLIKIVKGSKKLVAANEPENLKALIEEKLKKAQYVQHEFPHVLKMLHATHSQKEQAAESEIRNYKGINGVKNLYKEALRSQELRSIVNIEEVLSVFPQNSQLFDDAINHNPKMKMFEIVVESAHALDRMKQATGRTQNYFFKFLPATTQIRSTDILIYDGNVSFIEIKNQVNAVTLCNTTLYNNFVLLFDFIWNMLPEPVL